jgi:hypothetical protein
VAPRHTLQNHQSAPENSRFLPSLFGGRVTPGFVRKLQWIRGSRQPQAVSPLT